MAKILKGTLAVYTAVTAVAGLSLLLAPGRFLGLFDWLPVDPILSRILGAALLALAWSALRGLRAGGGAITALVVEVQAGFCLLAALGVLRHLLFAHYPAVVWILFFALALFSLLWLAHIVRKA